LPRQTLHGGGVMWGRRKKPNEPVVPSPHVSQHRQGSPFRRTRTTLNWQRRVPLQWAHIVMIALDGPAFLHRLGALSAVDVIDGPWCRQDRRPSWLGARLSIRANVVSLSSSFPVIRGRPGGGKPQQDCRQPADHDLKSEKYAASPAPSRPPPYDGGGGRAAKLAPMSAALQSRAPSSLKESHGLLA